MARLQTTLSALRRLSNSIYSATIASPSWIIASTEVAEALSLYDDPKTPLQEFSERVWADVDETDAK